MIIDSNKNVKKTLKYLLGILVCIIILCTLYKTRHRILIYFSHYIKRFILGYGKFSALIFVIIYSLKPILLVIPASLLSIFAGRVFGPFKALLLSMIGCFFSGTLAFYLAKMLGKPFVDKLLKGKTLKLDSNIEQYGFRIMLLMRLSFIFPFDPLSYAAGLTKMKYRDFILGTLLGILPEMMSYSFMGNDFRRPLSLNFMLPIIITIFIAMTSSFIYKKLKN